MKINKRSICFTGSRPNNLYGYNMNSFEYLRLKITLHSEIIRQIQLAKHENMESLEFISGGALGIDTVAFQMVEKIKKSSKFPIQNIIAVPFKDQYKAWSKVSQIAYNKMLTNADKVVYVDNHCKNSGAYDRKKLLNRNIWMVDHADIVIGIYRKDMIDKSRGTKHCMTYAENQGKTVIKIEL